MSRITSNSSGALSRPLSKLMKYRLGAFLVLCLLFGGANQDIIGAKVYIYLSSVVLIAWSLMAVRADSKIWRMKPLLAFIGLFVIMACVYLIPLPPAVWSQLPGRDMVVQGFGLLQMDLPWLPLSLTPEKTLFSLFDLLPVCAVFLTFSCLASAKEVNFAIWSLLAFAVFSVVVVVLQLSDISDALNFYDIKNARSTSGFFTNANHQSTLLLMAIPFAFAMAARARKLIKRGAVTSRTPILLGMTGAFVFCVGILLPGSIAGYAMLIPVLLASCYLYFGHKRRQKLIWILIPCAMIGGVLFDFIFLGNHLQELIAELTQARQGSRPVMFAKTFTAIQDYFPFGTGPNSFRDVYEKYQLSGIYTILHAHNDYLELVLEYGAAGLLGLLAGLIWWGRRMISVFSSHNYIAKAAGIATACIVFHSLVDYPLRTIGLATLFVFCLCLMSDTGRNLDKK